MSDPILNSAMRRHPDWHVKVYNPSGRGASGTTSRGYLAEYDDAIREAKAQALRDAAEDLYSYRGRITTMEGAVTWIRDRADELEAGS